MKTNASNQRFAALPPGIVLYGGTGQAKVNREIVQHFGARVVAVVDDTPGLVSPFADVPLLQGRAALEAWLKTQVVAHLGFSVAIGNPHAGARRRIHEELLQLGLQSVTLVHPNAWVAQSAQLGAGSQVMAGAVIGVEAQVGRECIVNTKASVDHECILQDGVSIAPGATLCGLVHVGENAWIGTGAAVLPRVRIGANAIVGAGAVVTCDVPDGVTVVGVPAKPV